MQKKNPFWKRPEGIQAEPSAQQPREDRILSCWVFTWDDGMRKAGISQKHEEEWVIPYRVEGGAILAKVFLEFKYNPHQQGTEMGV